MRPNQCFWAILLLSALCFIMSKADLGLFNDHHVKIINDLTSRNNLKVHCKSGDDDLGFHNLWYKKEYEFSFADDYIGKTLFFCNLWQRKLHAVFDAYVGRPSFYDKQCGGITCIWYAREDGVWLYNTKNQTYQYKYSWEPLNQADAPSSSMDEFDTHL